MKISLVACTTFLLGFLLAWSIFHPVPENTEKLSVLMRENNDLKSKLDEADDKADCFYAKYAKSQAAIAAIRDLDGVFQMIHTPEFREKFKPSWYDPDGFEVLLGSKWLLREIIRQKIVDPGAFGVEIYDRREFEPAAHKILSR